jgi:hypothetical protein
MTSDRREAAPPIAKETAASAGAVAWTQGRVEA